jgi:hypothetical protein
MAKLGGESNETKQSDEGRARRIALRGEQFGLAAVQALIASVPRSIAATDDVAEAPAALWSAERVNAVRAGSLPSAPAEDRARLQMASWY